MKPHIKIPKAWLEKFCKENHIIKMSLFGSVLSNHFTDASDVDILVEFDPKHIPGLFRNEVIQQSHPIYGKERFKMTSAKNERLSHPTVELTL